MINPIRLSAASGSSAASRRSIGRRQRSAPALIAAVASLVATIFLSTVLTQPAAARDAAEREATVLALAAVAAKGVATTGDERRAAPPLAALGGLLAAPLATTYRLTSAYGVRRGERRWHLGVDLAAPRGTPVRAAAAGVVAKVERQRGYGRIIVVSHPGGCETRYAHLHAYSVKAGQKVLAGQTIGAVGASGRATGPHLHFELRKDGKPLNPSKLIEAGSARQRIVLAPSRRKPAPRRVVVSSDLAEPAFRERWRD